jgi:hypothetical protein
MNDEDQLQPGLSPESTLVAFAAACNQDANRLFITESWFRSYGARLVSALPARLTGELVEALRDALYKRRPLEMVVEFIEQQPMTWAEYAESRVQQDRKIHLESARRGLFPWPMSMHPKRTRCCSNRKRTRNTRGQKLPWL